MGSSSDPPGSSRSTTLSSQVSRVAPASSTATRLARIDQSVGAAGLAMKQPPIHFTGLHVIALRSFLALSQRQLADRLHTKQPAISRWESGLFSPSRSAQIALNLIAHIAHVDQAQLEERIATMRVNDRVADRTRKRAVRNQAENALESLISFQEEQRKEREKSVIPEE